MIIDPKDWNRRLQDAIDKAFPGKQLKIDENTTSLNRMIKDSLHRRGIAADKAAVQKEMQEIFATLNATDPR
jgi:glutathionyl-hydroquinone reductase